MGMKQRETEKDRQTDRDREIETERQREQSYMGRNVMLFTVGISRHACR